MSQKRTTTRVLRAAAGGEITPTKNTADLVALTPYREMELTAPVSRGPSMLARVGAAVLPRFIGARWQWYRRALGGRWCFFWKRKDGSQPWSEHGWLRVPMCPHMSGWPLMFSNGHGRVGACRMDGDCHCEVYR